ncbi:MAG: type II secretion system protein, partial [Fibrobacterales bacterium]|nr:type II secretion system protein [Fibrobacterales bacterium]
MNRTNSQKGFTLVELAVYMVVASIAITLAAHMFTVASVSNVDTRKRAEMGRDIQEMLFFV